MNLKKTKEGGFINERFEKLYRMGGYAMLFLLCIAFIVLLVNCFTDPQ